MVSDDGSRHILLKNTGRNRWGRIRTKNYIVFLANGVINIEDLMIIYSV